jgi:Protein of unknown function (DUF2911)/Tetratricopeptide repeat
MQRVRGVISLGVLLVCAVAGYAQSFVLDLPLQSQRAVIEQRIGITDITISYHRPLVNNRKVWGGLVPYGQVWRAGANENTTIRFTDPVMIEGKPLDRGTYGLHMIPDQQQWTIIFSKNSTSWGSFTYDQAEDALRVTVKPQTADFHEALTYDFDNPTADSGVITMRWEKVAVPFKVSVNVNEVVAQSLHKQLRGLAQYSWEGWDDAANYLLANKGDLNEALKDSNQSIQVEERFDNLVTKSKVLDALGQKDQAKASLDKALAMGTPIQIHMYARQLQADKHSEEAYAIFRSNAEKHPDEWFVHSGLARVYCSKGDYDNAAKEMRLALAGAPEQQKAYVAGLVKRLEAKDNIN